METEIGKTEMEIRMLLDRNTVMTGQSEDESLHILKLGSAQ